MSASFQAGDTLNLVFFLALIVIGVVVLASRKRMDWAEVLSGNKLICFYLLYCLLSVGWSPYPFIAFKRWVKEAGNLVMVLLILSEDHPLDAIAATLRRLSYLLLPLSVLFIKYYPALGRGYTDQGGQMFTGIGMQKNELGGLCLICCFYYGWHFIFRGRTGRSFSGANNSYSRGPDDRDVSSEIIHLVLAAMLLWLFRMSQSATSMVCAAVAVALFLAARATSSSPGRVVTLATVASLSYFVLDATTGIKGYVLHILGRRPDLTDRTFIWAVTSKLAGNPLIGVGYQSFWLGDRLKELWENTGAHLIQAHNGYLEQYLDLGYIGVALVIALMVLGLFRVRKLLAKDNAAGALMFSFIVVIALYNYTEASFYAMSNLWLLFILAIVKIPERELDMETENDALSLWKSTGGRFLSAGIRGWQRLPE
ncbi:MAG: O-antigen ligase family protein [Syntrophobacteraceae bacterium]|nr:O-antigen ligase family protein [Syntrophobacteraceae bacterium]